MEDLEPSPLVAQLVKTPPAMWETWVQSLGWEGPLEMPAQGVPLDFCSSSQNAGGSDGKESACNARGLGSTPESGRSPAGGHGNPLQYSCLENPMDRGA